MFWFQVLIPNSWFDLRWKSGKNMITCYLTQVISYSWQFHCVCIHFPQLIFSCFYLFKTTLCFWAAAVQLCSNSTAALLLSSRHRLTAPSQSLLRGSHLCPSTELAAYETLGNTSDSKGEHEIDLQTRVMQVPWWRGNVSHAEGGRGEWERGVHVWWKNKR